MFSKAFAARGQMLSIRRDTLSITTLRDFTKGMKNTGIKEETKSSVDFITIYGNAAFAKITLELPNTYFHDLMSLLKTENGWRIVWEIFSPENPGKKNELTTRCTMRVNKSK